MDFFDILKDTFVKGESGQDVTVNELVEEIKEKLSGIIEEPDSIWFVDNSSWAYWCLKTNRVPSPLWHDVILVTFGGLLGIFFSCFDEEAAIESEEIIWLHIMKEHVHNMLLICRLWMINFVGEDKK